MVSCWNSRGLSVAIPFLRDMMLRNDIIFLSEHWLQKNRLYVLDEIDSNFQCFGRASKGAPAESYGLHRGQGGVAIFWRNDFKGVSTMDTVRHHRICG